MWWMQLGNEWNNGMDKRMGWMKNGMNGKWDEK